MQIQEIYSFNSKDYDSKGLNKFKQEFLFTDQIKQFEKDFIEKYSKLTPANYLFANSSTMRLIEQCFIIEDNEIFGMDLINGEIDFETNFKIEEYSENITTYAISSFLDEKEPLFLIIDNNLSDNKLILKYISDSDENDNFNEVPTIDNVINKIKI